MEINTDPQPVTEQKRLDICITLPSGTQFNHTIREEFGDRWSLRDGVLKIILFRNAGDQSPAWEFAYFAGHLAGISHQTYTQKVRGENKPSVLVGIFGEKK